MIVKYIFIFILVLLAAAQNIFSQSKPNIVIFLVDDMGWQDCSVSFWNKKTPSNSIYETPNLQRLAHQGIKFTNAYANTVCTPTRISIMTGMNVARHRVTNWTNVLKDTPTDYPDSLLIPPMWNYNGLSPTAGTAHTIVATPLPSLLKNAGYYTIHCGKGHFGPYGTLGGNPINIGFDVNIAGSAAGNPGSFLANEQYRGKNNDTLWAVRGLDQYIKNGDFITDALTQEAIHAMDDAKSKKQPFFLYLAQYAVHLPFSKDNRFYDKYRKKGLSDTEARYAGLIEGMDKSLGEILDHLEKIDEHNNTYFVFLSDNGGLSLNPPRSNTAHTQNLPLKMGKGSLYEGGIRIPMVMTGPKIKAGLTLNQLVSVDDIFPTILEWAELSTTKMEQQLDGISINQFINHPNKKNTKHPYVWHYPNNWTNVNLHGISWSTAMRKGNWKLIYFHKDAVLELYNIRKDISETKNLVENKKQKLLLMSKQMTKLLQDRKAQMPKYKLTGKEIPWPDEIAQEIKVRIK